MKEIKRDVCGFITDECMREMENSLPIELYVNDDQAPAWVAQTKEDLARYFRGALPYVLTTRFNKAGK